MIAGGTVPTIAPEIVFNESLNIDALCFSEGELPFVDLLKSDDISEVIREHQSWLSYSDFIKGKTVKAKLISELNDIPPVVYSLIDMSQYTVGTSVMHNIEEDNPPFIMISSRGCPFSCTFCCIASKQGKKMRFYTAERFLADVDDLVVNHNMKRLWISDDQFLIDKKRAIDILTGLAKYNIDIQFPNGLSIRFFDEDVIKAFKFANVKTVILALESGSERVLKELMNKPVDLEHTKKVVKMLRDVKICVIATIIYGMPYETAENRKECRDYIIDTGFDWIWAYTASPLKGSKLFDICVENDFIKQEDFLENNSSIFTGIINAPGVNPEKISKEVYQLNLDVNFVNNFSYKNGDYDRAKKLFEQIVLKYPDHAFGYYFLSKTLKKIPHTPLSEISESMNKYFEIIHTDKVWYDHAKHFQLCTDKHSEC